MASPAVARPLAAFSANAAFGLRSAARSSRGFATTTSTTHRAQLQQTVKRNTPARIPRDSVQQGFRRNYASETPKVAKKKSFRFLRWTWRLTYLSAIGGFAWMCWGIYQNRTPEDQAEPDPKKKTLVVLGTLFCSCALNALVRWGSPLQP